MKGFEQTMNNKTTLLITILLLLSFIFGALVGGLVIYRHMEPINTKLTEDFDSIQKQLKVKTEELTEAKLQLLNVQEQLCSEIEKTTELSDELNNIHTELDSVNNKLQDTNIIVEDLKNSGYELVYFGNFQLTHYCNERREHICGYGQGITATGTTATVGRTIAVDPRVIPYGSQVYIEGYGWRTAEDCGGGVNDNQIDILVDTHSQALSLGVQYGDVWILVGTTS